MGFRQLTFEFAVKTLRLITKSTWEVVKGGLYFSLLFVILVLIFLLFLAEVMIIPLAFVQGIISDLYPNYGRLIRTRSLFDYMDKLVDKVSLGAEVYQTDNG